MNKEKIAIYEELIEWANEHLKIMEKIKNISCPIHEPRCDNRLKGEKCDCGLDKIIKKNEI